jgi:hypothetical protein
MAKIFLSYRRYDTLAAAGRIYDKLAESFGRDEVFMDFDHIPLGFDFRKHLQDALQQCDLLLVLIGPNWLGTDAVGVHNKLWEPTDYVRHEIEIALHREIPIIPVLVGRASLPSQEHLPPEIQSLLYLQAASVDIGQDFHNHMDRLISGIKNLQKTRRSTLHKHKIRSLGANDVFGTYLLPLIRVLVWSTIGFIAGLVSQVLNGLNKQAWQVAPGITFGAVIYLFGEYSSSPALGRRKRAISYFVLTVACTLGWFLAWSTAAQIYDLNDNTNNTIGFFIAGVVGGTVIVSAEIWCWDLTYTEWTYTTLVVTVAGFSGAIVYDYYHRGHLFLFFAIWQALVLASTEIAAIFARKKLRR